MSKKQSTSQSSLHHVMSVEDLLLTLLKISAFMLVFSIIMLLQIVGVSN
ncbi:MAG: hypothetical protein AM325_010445 [Candidatus Thorarchaeota archaeon SMTZ1-45]